MVPFITQHWHDLLLILVTVLTAVREVFDILGDKAPLGALDALVSLLKKLTGNSNSPTPPPPSPPKA